MPDRPALPSHDDSRPDDHGRLSGWEVLQAEGRDAADFLQRQCMNDITALDRDGAWQWNGLLSAKGRVQALFAMLRRSETCFWLLSPDVPAAELSDALRRFVFRSKVRIEPLTTVAQASWPSTPGNTPEPLAQLTEDGIALSLPGTTGERRLQVTTNPAPQPADTLADARWRLDDLFTGLPRLAAAQRDLWTPHMLSLDALNAFSLKKGCYPGQEIVARTHYLGRSKRRMYRLAGDAPIAEDCALIDTAEQELGRTICTANWQAHHLAMALLPDGLAADTRLQADDQSVRLITSQTP